jgi:Cu-processing system permease protein
MINTIALHKLAKLRHSRMLLIFFIAYVCLGPLSFLPVIIMGVIAGDKMAGAEAATMYFGLARVFGLIVAVLIGSTLWRQDEKDGTLLTFMARPISRIELLLGKLLGGIYALAIYLAGIVLFYLILHLLIFRFSIPISFLLYLMQEMLFYIMYLAAGAFFSSFLKPLLAATAIFGWMFLYLLAKIFVSMSPAWSQVVGKVLRFVSIDLNISYGIRELFTADIPTIMPLFKGIGYYLLWATLFISAAIILFNKREFAGRRS